MYLCGTGWLEPWPEISGNVFEIYTPFGCLFNKVVLENYQFTSEFELKIV